MSDLGNKEVMAKNLQYYIDRSGKDRKTLCKIWGFPYSTVSEWLNARKYPRIDRIELMAEYFGIQKSDLIEDKTSPPPRSSLPPEVQGKTMAEKKLYMTQQVMQLSDEQLDKIAQVMVEMGLLK